jgi:CRISPR type III-B/RAMP module RAMP protein Cmr6
MAKMKFEEWQNKQNPSRKVTATVTKINDKGFCFLSSKEVKSIFLHFNQLRDKEISSDTLSEGDKFDLEVSEGTKGYQVDVIFAYKPIEKKEVEDTSLYPKIRNFSSFLHKQKRFDNNFDVFKINVLDKDFSTDHKGKKQEKEISLIETFEELAGWENEIFYQGLVTRHHNNAKQLTSGNLLPKVYDKKSTNELQFKPDWRLAIGLGSGSIFETSISLHHIYGFPYIPASAIKGVLRSYLITTLEGINEDSEALLFHKSKEVCDIFGCGKETMYDENGKVKKKSTFYKRCFDEDKLQFEEDKSKYRYPKVIEKIGDIIFFDAYPIHSPKDCIKADIMNPHYPDYYGNKNLPPADWQSPIPIIFLTVENLKFQFMVGLRKGVENINIELGDKNGDMLSVVSEFLKEALENHGIGAKTAVGYGYMTDQNP